MSNISLSINSRESSDLLHYLAHSIINRSKTSYIYFLIAKAWGDGEFSIHVHANLYIRGETQPHKLCWIFMRERRPRGNFHFDRLNIGRIPLNHSRKSELVRNGHTNKDGTVLINVGQQSDGCEHILTRLNSIEFAVKPRLRLLDDCPCVSINGYPVEGTARLRILQREFHFFKELDLRAADREFISLVRFIALPKNKLPDNIIKSCSKIIEEIPNDERKVWGELRDWVARHDVPLAISLELDETGISVRYPKSRQFSIGLTEVYFSPSEFGSNSRKVSNANTHMLYCPFVKGD